MSVATQLNESGTRSILGPAGNRVPVLEENQRRKKNEGQDLKNTEKINRKKGPVEKPGNAKPVVVLVKKNHNGSVDSLSSDSSSSSSASASSGKVSVRSLCSKGRVKSGGKPAKVAPESLASAPVVPGLLKRCDWITPNSDTLYTSFHDEEWGYPVWDDTKLFELLVLSQALAEHTWPDILNKREIFRRLFDNFNPSSVANFDDKKLLSMRVNGSTLLSEPKLRAIADNAKQLLKIQQEFGSFSNYCWRFVNHKPVNSGFRYSRQIPAKTPKSELISKDLMRRGFCCVGPTIVYSFMQVSGMVNDHLVTCFRYNECQQTVSKDLKSKPEKANLLRKAESSTLESPQVMTS